ncbi:MAG: hypothetical protein K2Y20_11855 [Sphingomonas sp.]|nr:hypothetical protein [Sphingomonas sp.]
MSVPVVWASTVMVSLSAKMPFENALVDVPRDPKLDTSRRNKAGEVLSAENFPREVWGMPRLNQSRPLPDIFMGYGPWIVSKAAADVMRQFDMGQGGFYPVRVLKKDLKTPFDGEWFCLNFGNVKKAYMGGGRDPTPYIPKDYISHTMPGSGIIKDNMLMVNADALVGPDIWVDPQIYDTFFVSDRLAKALKEAGVARAFGFKKCKII